VQRFDGEEWQTLTDCGQDLPPGNILDIDFASDGTAWVANGLALASYDGVSWTVYSKLANSIVVDPGAGEGPEAVWVSGWEGRENSMFIGRLAGGDWQQYAIADSYPGSFTASAVTPGGWLCGLNAGQGVACFDGSDWSSADAWTTHDEALGLDLGHSLGPPSSAPDGALWIVTPAGLLRWDAQREGRDAWTLYSPGSDQVLTRPGPLAFGPEGEVWIGATRFQP
jgi:hypothetical protein